MTTTQTATKPCPFCYEEVHIEAKKCKHCKETIDVVLRTAEETRRLVEQKSGQQQNPMVFMNAGGASSSSSSSAAAASASGRGHMVLRKPRGSVFWLVIWTILYIIPGVIYYRMRSWSWQR